MKSFSICIVQIGPLGLYCGNFQLNCYIHDEDAVLFTPNDIKIALRDPTNTSREIFDLFVLDPEMNRSP